MRDLTVQSLLGEAVQEDRRKPTAIRTVDLSARARAKGSCLMEKTRVSYVVLASYASAKLLPLTGAPTRWMGIRAQVLAFR